MSDSKNIQAENSYGNETVIKTFTGKTDIKKFVNSNLMIKDRELKSETTLIILVYFSEKKLHGE